MQTGFKKLDKIINLLEPQVILLTGSSLVAELSGDIAINVCLQQEKEVLEIVSSKKEYLIKRLLANNANVDYKSWTLKDKYNDEELKQIGQATVNLIEVTKRLPTINEQDMSLYNLKKVTKLVKDFANHYADRDTIESLVVLDICPLNSVHHNLKYGRQTKRLLKDMKKISKRLNCPILLTYSGDINKVCKYVDRCVILEESHNSIFNLKILDGNNIVGTCKLEYDFKCRRFKKEQL